MLAEKYLGKNLKDLQLAQMLREIVQGAQKYGLEIPPDFLLVGKALMTIDGIGKEIDPDLDFFQETRPYFIDILKKRYSPERIMNDAWRGLEKMSNAAYELPQQSQEVLEDLRLGRLEIRTIDPELSRALERLGRRVFSGLIAAALLLGASLLFTAPYQQTPGIVLFVVAAVLLLLHLLRDRRLK